MGAGKGEGRKGGAHRRKGVAGVWVAGRPLARTGEPFAPRQSPIGAADRSRIAPCGASRHPPPPLNGLSLLTDPPLPWFKRPWRFAMTERDRNGLEAINPRS
jgi:hypothetical protein